MPRAEGVLGWPHLPSRQTGVLSRPLLTAGLLGRQLPLDHLSRLACHVLLTNRLPTRHMLGRHLLGRHLPGRHLPGRHLPGRHLLARPQPLTDPSLLLGRPLQLQILLTWSGRAGEGITVMVLLSGDWVTGQLYFPSGEVWWTRPFSTLSSSLMMMTRRRLAVSRRPRWRIEDEDRDLRSPEDLRWWWAWEEEAEDRASVALETRLDPEPPVESACLLELDPPEDMGRDRSPSRRPLSCLEAWFLGESWRLSDLCDLLLRSPLHDLWRSDPSGAGPSHHIYAGSHRLLGFTGPSTQNLACLMVRTRFWRTFGSGPSTWEPSNGAVLTVDRTWGWNPKFFSKASRRSNWRLEAAAKPAYTSETWASWIMASFSLRSFVWSSLGESSSITDATMVSAREA